MKFLNYKTSKHVVQTEDIPMKITQSEEQRKYFLNMNGLVT